MKVADLKNEINKMGEQLLKAGSFYAGKSDVVCDISNGIIPRGLVYEEEGRSIDSRGSVIVGVNPGNAEPAEVEFYKKYSSNYGEIIKYWQEKILPKEYYCNLRRFADQINLIGPIVWTELVKCESASKNGKKVKLDVETVRADINKYLFNEVESTPDEWPLIGVGKPTYEILSYRFPKRIVIGVPHATASFGYFDRLFTNKEMNSESKEKIMKVLEKNNPISISLFEIKS